jgi:hypothetical protein
MNGSEGPEIEILTMPKVGRKLHFAFLNDGINIPPDQKLPEILKRAGVAVLPPGRKGKGYTCGQFSETELLRIKAVLQEPRILKEPKPSALISAREIVRGLDTPIPFGWRNELVSALLIHMGVKRSVISRFKGDAPRLRFKRLDSEKKSQLEDLIELAVNKQPIENLGVLAKASARRIINEAHPKVLPLGSQVKRI